MTKFRDTQSAADFIATGDSRETSPEIMRAIVFFARDLDEAILLWENGPENTSICTLSDFWEHVTGNGQRDASDYYWGASGNHWYDA